MSDGRVGWTLWEYMEATWRAEHPLCEAERHERSGIRAEYAVALHGAEVREMYGTDGHVFAACGACVGEMAADLGITIEDGILTT